MSKKWLHEKHDEFVRDLLQDFCLAVQLLENAFKAFDLDGRIEFEALRDILGEEMNKGLLWRLKDTAHHLFRNQPEKSQIGQFLDWCIGYIFHETMKLKEDAYQQQNYAPWFRQLQDKKLPESDLIISRELFQLLMQTAESMQREIRRIRFIVRQCHRLFPLYLEDQEGNLWLARFLFKRDELVREVFEDAYEDLIRAIYKDAPEKLYVMASRSLREGGWVPQAAEAAEAAFAVNPVSALVLREKEVLESWRARLKT